MTESIKWESWGSGNALFLHLGIEHKSVTILQTFMELKKKKKENTVGRSNGRATKAHPRHTYTL